MKRNYSYWFAAIAALSFFASCAVESPESVEPEGAETVTIRVSVPEDAGRVSITEADDFKRAVLQWQADDQLTVSGATTQVFTIDAQSISEDGHSATFTGTAPGDGPYTITYGGASAFGGDAYDGQVQAGNSSTDHLEYVVVLSGVDSYDDITFSADWAEEHGGSIDQNGVLQMRLQFPDEVTEVYSVYLDDADAFKHTLWLSGALPDAQKVVNAYMMIPPCTVGESLSLRAETDAGSYAVAVNTEGNHVWAGGAQYTIKKNLRSVAPVQVMQIALRCPVDLLQFAEGVNASNARFQGAEVTMQKDLDLGGVSGWTPIGNGTFEPTESGSVSATWTEPAFKGTFNGGGHAIKNLDMTASPAEYSSYGLFGILYKATVKDLTLGAADGDTGKLVATPTGRMDAGAVAGVSYGSTILNVTNYYPMTIPVNSSPSRVEMAMVGYVYGDAISGISQIISLNNYGKVSAGQSSSNETNGALSVQVAGIAGLSNTGAASIINEITDCTNYADIEAATARCAGILSSANSRTKIELCNNEGAISNTWTGNARPGGITCIIAANCTLTGCVNNGDVSVSSSGANAGGIICLVNGATAKVENCTNNGEVDGGTAGASYMGGIASRIYTGTITGCVNTGDVSGSAKVGGIVGGLGNNSAFPRVEKCRSNAAISATLNGQDCVGGIAGEMYSGILNTCSAKGSVTGAGYDIGGIVGLMYCTTAGADYGRQYVYDCLAANDVTCTRTSGSANLGGVVGRMLRHSTITDQYMALDNCIGLNQRLSAGARPYMGVFAGNVTASVATNFNRVRVRNNISLVENANLVCTATSNKGGFVGAMPYGYMAENYYLVDNNSQTIGGSGNATAVNVTQSTLANLTSAAFCESFSTKGQTYFLSFGSPSVRYQSSGWEIPAGCSYPVPSTLAALGEAYYK
ncbi:MAG: hypothetical protein IJS62_02165 [Bacteroidales bacterium]|nr:hypothetical protein [Bacteroidales bacterium]